MVMSREYNPQGEKFRKVMWSLKAVHDLCLGRGNLLEEEPHIEPIAETLDDGNVHIQLDDVP